MCSLDFLIVGFVAGSNGCIEQALLKWALKSPQLLITHYLSESLRRS